MKKLKIVFIVILGFVSRANCMDEFLCNEQLPAEPSQLEHASSININTYDDRFKVCVNTSVGKMTIFDNGTGVQVTELNDDMLIGVFGIRSESVPSNIFHQPNIFYISTARCLGMFNEITLYQFDTESKSLIRQSSDRYLRTNIIQEKPAQRSWIRRDLSNRNHAYKITADIEEKKYQISLYESFDNFVTSTKILDNNSVPASYQINDATVTSDKAIKLTVGNNRTNILISPNYPNMALLIRTECGCIADRQWF